MAVLEILGIYRNYGVLEWLKNKCRGNERSYDEDEKGDALQYDRRESERIMQTGYEAEICRMDMLRQLM